MTSTTTTTTANSNTTTTTITTSNNNMNEPPIWTFRSVDWPLPVTIKNATQMNPGTIQKLINQGQIQLQNQPYYFYPNATTTSKRPTSVTTLLGTDDRNKNNNNNNNTGGGDVPNNHNTPTKSSSLNTEESNNNNNTFLTGFMSRVLGPTSTTSATQSGNSSSGSGTGGGFGTNTMSDMDQQSHPPHHYHQHQQQSQQSQQQQQQYVILPPLPHCVAAANGWIVSVVECYPTSNNAGTSNKNSPISTTSLSPSSSSVVRLLSRWNVRRGSGGIGLTGSFANTADQWIVLPPPTGIIKIVPTTQNNNNNNQQQQNQDYRIRHVFVDPTACHTLVSAANGEAYYIHSAAGSSSSSNTNANTNTIPTGGTTTGATQQQLSNMTLSNQSSLPILKLPGFGVTSTKPEWITGVAATAVPPNTPTVVAVSSSSSSTTTSTTPATSSSNSSQLVQVGLTPHTYVTAVAWDRERGTEGSSKTILIGTNLGEIYEYSLNPHHYSGNHNTSGSSSTNTSSSGYPLPILLHKLYATPHHGISSSKTGTGKSTIASSTTSTSDPSEVGAAVTGIYFERLRTGLFVIVATSGTYKRTRLYTFYCPTSTSNFRMVFSPSTNNMSVTDTGGTSSNQMTLQELPGSIDYADLRFCTDSFALRTATGIYYGAIDRSLSGPIGLAGGGSSMIIDSGLLSYQEILQSANALLVTQQQQQQQYNQKSLTVRQQQQQQMQQQQQQQQKSTSMMPLSIALTPHHIVLWTDHNEVYFVNRVAQKVIQRERMDHESTLSSSSSSSFFGGELLMDIRRQDQVWLRKQQTLLHISPSQEDRDVWKYTLYKCLQNMHRTNNNSLRGSSHHKTTTSSSSSTRSSSTTTTEEEKVSELLFEQAKTLCTNALQKSVVTSIRGEYHLLRGRGELAAKYFAQCPPTIQPFTKTAIRLALPKLGINIIDDNHHQHPSDSSYNNHQSSASLGRHSLENSNLPLITYLNDKMRVAAMNDDKMTCTMLGAWLTELFLHERSEQLAAVHQYHGIANSTSKTGTATTTASLLRETEKAQRVMLGQFLNANVQSMDAKTIIKILTSHDVSASECANYAAKSGDIATAVNAVLSVGGTPDPKGASEALRVLNDAPFELSEPLYYKHALTLLSLIPSAAGDSFLARYSMGLSPLRLLPSIMHYEKVRATRLRVKQAMDATNSFGSESMGGIEESKSSMDYLNGPKESPEGFELKIEATGFHQATSFVDDSNVSIRYLEGVIKQGCRSGAIYNYLVSLYTKMEDEEPLYNFLSTHVPPMTTSIGENKKAILVGDRSYFVDNDVSSSPLDISYALRAVLGSGRHFRSAIKLYMGFGMRQQAVELALKVDPSLARKLAQDSIELDERKRLWLMIAKTAATTGSGLGGKDVVARVVSVLRDCGPDILSIEDVLPFLPDFAQIDQIKDEICEALTSYSSKIEGFMREMKDCDALCATVRTDIGRLRNHHSRLQANARCAITNQLVMTAGEPFYVFPSGYVFLQSALKREVFPYLTESQRRRVTELEGILRNNTYGPPLQSQRLSLQTELDGLLGAECPFTGSIMVDSIDQDFLDTNEMFDGLHYNPIERMDV